LAPLFLYLATRLNSNIFVSAAVALAMGFAGACEGPIWATAIDIGGREVGAACGILNGGGNVGGFLGPLLTPIIASLAGWGWAVDVACLIAFLGALVFLAIDPTKQITEGVTHDMVVVPVPFQE
jgi:MFS family permease